MLHFFMGMGMETETEMEPCDCRQPEPQAVAMPIPVLSAVMSWDMAVTERIQYVAVSYAVCCEIMRWQMAIAAQQRAGLYMADSLLPCMLTYCSNQDCR